MKRNNILIRKGEREMEPLFIKSLALLLILLTIF